MAQVLTVDLAYCSAASPLDTHHPRDSRDVSGFLVFISEAVPGLEALKVTAMRRDVALDVRRMPWRHLALACRRALSGVMPIRSQDQDKSCSRVVMIVGYSGPNIG